ncbi:Ribose ABC transporter permease [Pseudomonas amygdali pv. photiniae]|uniref:Ribose ABC transporter permease n=1 Tax=Pseudomonas amygdali pv. photiniae TaxID=251724 RepID=A0A0N8RXJ2_PSEA0|nr:Ribose ABC transporter permease [Pseudomonas amygdali pv. photiniae]
MDAKAPAHQAAARPSGRAWLLKLLPDNIGGPLIGLALLLVVFSFSSEFFFTLRNGLNILDQVTVLGILAIGMTAVIVIGGIDLSVGSVLAFSMMMLGWLGAGPGDPDSHSDRHARRAGVRLADYLRQTARLYRHADDDVGRPRPGKYSYRRPADRRLPGVVHQPGHRAPFRLSVGHSRAVSGHAGRGLGIPAFSGRWAQPVRHWRQP